MCHLCMKLSNKFDPNQMYTSDKRVVKHISVKETLLKLDLEPKGQGHSKQQNNKRGNKNIPPLKVYTEGFRVPVLNRRVIGCKSVNLYPMLSNLIKKMFFL